MPLVLQTAPTSEPVTTAEAKAHLRITTSDDDTYIGTLIAVARKHVETITGRALINQTWDYFLDNFPPGDKIVIPLPRLSSVTSVKYTDKDNVQTTLAASKYIVDTNNEPGQIVLAYGESWPTFTQKPINAVEIRFVAGYGSGAANVPEGIKQAMLLLIAHWYENREPVNIGNIVTEIPETINALLWPYRIMQFA